MFLTTGSALGLTTQKIPTSKIGNEDLNTILIVEVKNGNKASVPLDCSGENGSESNFLPNCNLSRTV